MSWFARIEENCASFIERAFAAMFPSDLEPAQIARKLVATMEARSTAPGGRLAGPHRYDVYVHPGDFERLAEHRQYLEQQWRALLEDVASRVDIRFGRPLEVTLAPRQSVPPGGIEIETRAEEPNGCYVLSMLAGMPAEGRWFVGGTVYVGRSPENDVFLVDPSVSRRHAVLEVRGDLLLVRDLASTNGTFVNGERVQLRTLQPGDVVAFGKTEMKVEAPS